MLGRLVSGALIVAVIYLIWREATTGDVSCWFDNFWYQLGVKAEPTC